VGIIPQLGERWWVKERLCQRNKKKEKRKKRKKKRRGGGKAEWEGKKLVRKERGGKKRGTRQRPEGRRR